MGDWEAGKGGRYTVTCIPFIYIEFVPFTNIGASQVMLVVKNPPTNVGDLRDMGLIPGSWRSPEEGRATHSSILAWRVLWTEEPGGL